MTSDFTFVLAVVVVILSAVGVGQCDRYINSPEARAQAKLRAWQQNLSEKCFSQKGRLWIDNERGGKHVECARTPLMRHPKVVFREEYKE